MLRAMCWLPRPTSRGSSSWDPRAAPRARFGGLSESRRLPPLPWPRLLRMRSPPRPSLPARCALLPVPVPEVDGPPPCEKLRSRSLMRASAVFVQPW
eukprot:2395860-Alexandrium_andersonii.AAC.1